MMYSIRNVCVLGLAAMAIAGCQEKPAEVPAAMNTDPLIIDQAMQKRDWDAVPAIYANDHVPSNADRFPLEASASTVDNWGWATETPIFLGNTVIEPFTYFTTKPFKVIYYPSVTTPPTYTAMPPTQSIGPFGVEDDARRGSTVAVAGTANAAGGTNITPGSPGSGSNANSGAGGANGSSSSGGGSAGGSR